MEFKRTRSRLDLSIYGIDYGCNGFDTVVLCNLLKILCFSSEFFCLLLKTYDIFLIMSGTVVFTVRYEKAYKFLKSSIDF